MFDCSESDLPGFQLITSLLSRSRHATFLCSRVLSHTCLFRIRVGASHLFGQQEHALSSGVTGSKLVPRLASLVYVGIFFVTPLAFGGEELCINRGPRPLASVLFFTQTEVYHACLRIARFPNPAVTWNFKLPQENPQDLVRPPHARTLLMLVGISRIRITTPTHRNTRVASPVSVGAFPFIRLGVLFVKNVL